MTDPMPPHPSSAHSASSAVDHPLSVIRPPSSVSLAVIEHPFRRDLRETVLVPLAAPMSLLDLRLRHFPSDLPAIVYLNGALVPEERLASAYLKSNDYVMILAAVSGGGSGGKGILRAILMIAVAAVAFFAAPWMMGFTIFWGNTLLTGLLTGALTLIGGLVVNALLPPATAKTSTSDSSLDSQAYSWSPQNTAQQGIPLARWYGFHKVYGNIIASYIESIGCDQYLNALICIGLGPVAGFGDFHINDQPAANFKEVVIQCRNGFLNQPAMSNFVTTKTEYSSSVQLIGFTAYTYITVGNDFDGLEIDISFPYGLWWTNDASTELMTQYVAMRIEV